MKDKFIPGIEEAIRRGEGKVAAELDAAAKAYEEGAEGPVFIKATRQFLDNPDPHCLVLPEVPESVLQGNDSRVAEYISYLLRAAERREAFFTDDDGDKQIIVRLFGRHEEGYTPGALGDSIRQKVRRFREQKHTP